MAWYIGFCKATPQIGPQLPWSGVRQRPQMSFPRSVVTGSSLAGKAVLINRPPRPDFTRTYSHLVRSLRYCFLILWPNSNVPWALKTFLLFNSIILSYNGTRDKHKLQISTRLYKILPSFLRFILTLFNMFCINSSHLFTILASLIVNV
jgi:hypothetical protein